MKFVPIKVSRAIAQQVLIAKKNSPHFFFAGGMVGVVGSTVLACKATLKLEATVDDIQKDISEVRTKHESIQTPNDVPTREYRVEMGHVYVDSAKKLGRLYGPSVALGVVSIAALTGSHIQLTRRNTALTAALAAVTKAYEEYRQRVQAELGKDREIELYHDIQEQKNAEGKKVKVGNPHGLSPYAALFDQTTTNEWLKNAEMNLAFLECQQRYANHKLNVNGFVLLNDVYDSLGLDRTSAGAVVGWVLNRDGETEGDGYIDFGIYEARNVNFINNIEPSIWLDFNVDGVVYNLIDRR